MLESSLEWNSQRRRFSAILSKLPSDTSLDLMLRNIDGMVRTLSQLEVDSRRTKQQLRVREQLAKVNDAIDNLEGWIIFAELLR